ncbi:P-loop NTPase fold protein [uncultured Nisaea sp.]|uniref:KAP family P-loop NTPase fold protein n=1 Tax=uncultured Nisaea sp. TaxID=538215 RepID=UPI0030EC5BE6|tara:strand:- start:1785 stop:3965 length:2181 start_codon:yes stop_codon:yes gene_type:complete
MSESKRNYFNDSPIEATDDDRYGVTGFAESIAKSITRMPKPVGTTIALNGPWGSGKSSVVNLIRASLTQSGNDKLVVSDFKCWWYRGEEALALAFLQSLNGTLRTSLGDKVKDLIPSITQRLLQAGPTIGAAVTLASGAPLTALFTGGSKFVSTFFPQGDTLEKTFQKLANILANEDRRFLVVIDDIDRLTPEEAIAIFRLVKSIGSLPNVMYLLVFDRDLAEKAVQERFPSEGPHFLEKIVQAGFELPRPLQTDLNQAVLTAIQEICGDPEEAQIVRIMNLFYDIVAPYMATPRHVARYQNAISVTWPAVEGEVSLADFIALEALRLYEPGLFRAIRSRKEEACGISNQHNGNQNHDDRLKPFLDDVPLSRHALAKGALQRLFPRLENMGYGGDWISRWDVERRVCIEAHFDTYFRLTLSDETLPTKFIEEMTKRADDVDLIKTTMRAAAKIIRRNSKSMVPVYLDELTTHAARIDVEKVPAFLGALFEIHDEIDLEADAERGFGGIANTSLRYHWLLRRVTAERLTPEERSNVLVAAVQNAPLGWLVDFASSAIGDHEEEREQGPKRDEDCLVQASAIEPVRKLALDTIRTAAANGSLIGHRDLVYVLYRWRDLLGGDPTEVREWTGARILEDSSLVAFARDFTGRSWSMGMSGLGSLGDRVSKATIVAQISDDTEIIDSEAFRARLEEIAADGKLKQDDLKTVQTLLDAWDRKRAGKNGLFDR